MGGQIRFYEKKIFWMSSSMRKTQKVVFGGSFLVINFLFLGIFYHEILHVSSEWMLTHVHKKKILSEVIEKFFFLKNQLYPPK